MTDSNDNTARAILIGQRLAKSRLEAGIEYAVDAADAIGVNRTTYLCYERGDRVEVLARWLDVAERFGKRVGVTPAYVLGLIDEKMTDSEFKLRLKLGGEWAAMMSSRIGGAASDVFAVTLEHDMPPHRRGDLLFFDRRQRPQPDDPAALYALHGRVQGEYVTRWIGSTLDGNFVIDDGGCSYTLTAEQLGESNIARIAGKYLFKLTD